jgi:hypothetical protein
MKIGWRFHLKGRRNVVEISAGKPVLTVIDWLDSTDYSANNPKRRLEKNSEWSIIMNSFSILSYLPKNWA